MPNSINININSGGLGRALPGEDFISGYLHYTTTLPSGFSSSARIKEVFSVSEAEDLGITDTHIGEVRATGSTTVLATGATNDVLTLKVSTQLATVTLATLTQDGTYTTPTSCASEIASLVNDDTATHGFTATASTTSVIITTPSGSGAGGNSYTFASTYSGTLSASTGTFTGGIASEIDIIHYHVTEYFRAQPKGDLFIGIYTANTSFDEVATIQNFSEGRIRQLAVFTPATFATSQCNALQTQATACESVYKPLEIILQANFTGTSSLSTLSSLTTLSDKNVSVCIGQDGGNVGRNLYLASNKSIGQVGLLLGTVAAASVAESIAWVGQFQMASDECDTLAFANGTLYSTLSDSAIDSVDSKGYVFLKKHIGLNGSYWDNDYTCIANTSDFCRIKANRVMHKASRSLRTQLLPSLAAKVYVKADGTLSENTIAHFENECKKALDQMLRDGEVSDFGVTINPAQDVLSTGKISISVAIIPVGSADTIEVQTSFALSL